MEFTRADIENIAEALKAKFKDMGNNYRLTIASEEEDRRISLEIYPKTQMGKDAGSLILVYTSSSFMQLQCCTGYVISKMLGEVTFVAEHAGRLSGLIVEQGAGCSLYSNVDQSVLSGDFTKLGPEVMMSSIALSLSEHLVTTGETSLDADALDADDDDE